MLELDDDVNEAHDVFIEFEQDLNRCDMFDFRSDSDNDQDVAPVNKKKRLLSDREDEEMPEVGTILKRKVEQEVVPTMEPKRKNVLRYQMMRWNLLMNPRTDFQVNVTAAAKVQNPCQIA
jgi:hypothetical protein